jgi:hypothetical protein
MSTGLSQRAVQLTPDGDRAMSSRLANLGLFLLSRFNYGENLSVIHSAISYLQKVFQLTPEGLMSHPLSIA